MLLSIGFISCGFEDVVAFFFGQEFADVADRFPELIVGPGSGFAYHGFEFGKYHLDLGNRQFLESFTLR